MSEQKFKDAKGNLAFSQGLLDRLQQQQAPQQIPHQPDMGQQPMAPQPTQQPTQPESPQEESQEQKGIIQGVVDAISPFFEKITQAISGGANGADDKQEAEIPAKLDSLETKVDELIVSDKDVHKQLD